MGTNDLNNKNESRLDENSNHQDERNRLKVLQAGLATPFLMTLAAKPASANRGITSVAVSGNLSPPGGLQSCGTCDNSQWSGANRSQFHAAGIRDPHNFSIESIFRIPTIQGHLVLAGSIVDALHGKSIPSPLAVYRDSRRNRSVNPAKAKLALQEMMCFACTAYMNLMHPTTKTNFDLHLDRLLSDVNRAVTLSNDGNNTIEFNQILYVRETYFRLMDGSSCALT